MQNVGRGMKAGSSVSKDVVGNG